MAFGKWLAGGLIGGMVGAIVWVAIGYYLNAEVGYVAWGIGLLVGFGVRFSAASDGLDPSPMQGVLAAVIALAAILGAKYIVVDFLINDAMGPGVMEFDTEIDSIDIMSQFAGQIASEKAEAGEKLAWPKGMSAEDAYNQEDYPADVWAKAEKKWSALSEQQKADQIEEQKLMMEKMKELMGSDITSEVKKQAFLASFTPFDFLWFGLALYTAFSVAYGSEDD